MAITISDFFYKTFEIQINELMFDKNYVFPKTKVIEYICDICNFEFSDVLNYISKIQYLDPVTPENIFQFSSFDDCTINLCLKLDEANDEGFRFNQVGELFATVERNDMANRKYGENASKTAKELGICQIVDNYVFLSCIGKVLPEISEERRNKLISLLILRSNYFKTLFYMASRQKVDSCILMGALSESTKVRRRPNIKKLLVFLENNNDVSLNEVLNNIEY